MPTRILVALTGIPTFAKKAALFAHYQSPYWHIPRIKGFFRQLQCLLHPEYIICSALLHFALPGWDITDCYSGLKSINQ
jgi:hypothetical protein